jgi:hypothetical protein
LAQSLGEFGKRYHGEVRLRWPAPPVEGKPKLDTRRLL